MNAPAMKPAWANEKIRLDPYALPQRFSLGGKKGEADVEIHLATKGAVMKRKMSAGMPLSMALPCDAFIGVAARAFENEDGIATVTLELMHRDPALSVPLCVSDDVESVACDWHSWARQLGLAMLSVDSAGRVEIVKAKAGITPRGPQSRRLRNTFGGRRSRFLRKRRPGMTGPVERIEAREIIARS